MTPILFHEEPPLMKTLVAAVGLLVLLTGGIATGWWAMNRFYPASIGTPAHAGAVSNGRPEQCTNVSFTVPARHTVERTVMLQTGELLRGTFEANGGLGRVDIFLRVRNPQNDDILASPRAANYDFSFPARSHGEYVFIFDNRFSLFTAKGVGLFYCIDSPKLAPPVPNPAD
jgi:hypothetical protein